MWALPEHCFKILCYLALFSCLVLLVPTVGSLVFEHGNLNVLQIHLGLFSQNYFVYLEHFSSCCWSLSRATAGVKCGEGPVSQRLPQRSLASWEALGQGWCCSAQDQACSLQLRTIPRNSYVTAHILQCCPARGGNWALQEPLPQLWQSCSAWFQG